MRLLILGGTLFLGRHIVDAAAERGHELTLFNRGQTGPELYPEHETIVGDREHDLDRLSAGSWDAVIDTCGYVPRVVRAGLERLRGCAGRYVFISSVSVYASHERPGLNEDAPLAALPEPGSEDVARFYGELKAACEREVQQAFGDHALIARPGLIVGPHDPTERFTYWVARLSAGGRVMVPDARPQPVQLIDARDLAGWLLDAAQEGISGVFNLTGASLTLAELLERLRSALNPAAELAWVDEQLLAEAGVEPWSELPLWLDLPRHPELRGFLDVDISRALAAGLSFRTLEATAAETLAWVRERGAPNDSPAIGGVSRPPAGISRQRERQLLAAAGAGV